MTLPPRLKVFISYSHKDLVLKQKIERYLLSANSGIELLSDDALQPGAEWQKVLTDLRASADVFLLLISPAYLASETVNGNEMPQIMERAKSGDAHVLPFVLERCEWSHAPYAAYQALPKFGKPFIEFADEEKVLAQLAAALSSIVQTKQNFKAVEIILKEKRLKTGTLDLSACELEHIPRDLLEMDWLMALYLNKNNLTEIENLDKLGNLRLLDLSQNAIAEIKNLDNLKKLSSLDLHHNGIVHLDGLEQNAELTVLGLSSNRLEQLQHIAHLKKLHTLYAAHNRLANVAVLEKLPALKRIVLTNNQISSIKPLRTHIRNGLNVALKYSYSTGEEGIFIKDNKPLAEPSPEVIEKGHDAVLKYFGDAETYGTEKLEILKLVLVGNSKVGKSNFSEFLRGLSLTEKHNSTHLLDIQTWEAPFLKSESGTLTRVNIFDFGGQDYYHDSHRLYYSHDTAYVLLWDTSTNKYAEATETEGGQEFVYENYPLEYWLESIQFNLSDKFRYLYKETSADGKTKKATNSAPVLVLQNKIDVEEGRLDQQVLCRRYPSVSGFFNVSLTAKKRTDVLFDVLSDYLNALNLSGRQLIKYEYKIIEDYINHPREFAVITLDDFWKDCIRIIIDDKVDFNKDNAAIVAEILNSIGIIFYDKKSGTDGAIFTQIKRLNEIIKELMDVAKRENDKGIFSKAHLDNIPYKDEVVALLLRNNSIIAINDTEFLAPQFLPVHPDASVSFFLHAFVFHPVRYLYKAYFHKSLLLSLFSKYLSGTAAGANGLRQYPFWRNGIIISRGEGSTRQMVLVEFVKTETMGVVNIKTMSPYNKSGLEREIENMLDVLNSGWSVSKEIAVDSVHFFDVNYLKEEVKALRYEFSADGKIFTVNDFKHLTDFEKVPKKLFISYSSKNADFIKRFVTHLEVLKIAGLIDPWYDRMIESGARWDDAIRAEMKASDVVIFLLSPDFLATEYIMKTELPLAVEQQKDDPSRFFFIELQPCNWKLTDIAAYQQTDDGNTVEKNIISIGQPDNDAKWNLVIDELKKKIK